jgi:hypothetical protein
LLVADFQLSFACSTAEPQKESILGAAATRFKEALRGQSSKSGLICALMLTNYLDHADATSALRLQLGLFRHASDGLRSSPTQPLPGLLSIPSSSFRI